MKVSSIDDPPEASLSREAIAATLDPDADHQRWYTCNSCGWPCINPIGTIPERREECPDCVVSESGRQTAIQEYRTMPNRCDRCGWTNQAVSPVDVDGDLFALCRNCEKKVEARGRAQ